MLQDPILAAVRTLPLDNQQRRAAASLLHVQACGERIAMEGARAQAAIAPTRDACQFLLRQSRQEAFHVRLFSRLSRAMAASVDAANESDVTGGTAAAGEYDADFPAPLIRVRTLLFDAISREAYTEAVVIQHIALEGLGIAVLERLDAELAEIGRRFGRFRRLLLAQEAAHFAFGAQVLENHSHDVRHTRLMHQMLDEAEGLLVFVAPQFRLLGADVGDVSRLLRARTLAAAGTM